MQVDVEGSVQCRMSRYKEREVPAGLQDRGEIRKRVDVVLDVFEHVRADDRVETFRLKIGSVLIRERKWKRCDSDVGTPVELCAKSRQIVRFDVGRDHTLPVGEVHRLIANAGSHLENALA